VETAINEVHWFVTVSETCLVRSMDGVWSLTISVPDAVLPLPPCVDMTTVVVLFIVPDIAPVTRTLNAQLLFAASDPPVKDIVLGVVVVSEPLQVAVGPLLVTVTPAGNVSENLMPDSELDTFGLFTVKVKVDVLPVKIESGAKDLARTGGAITVRVEAPNPLEVVLVPLSVALIFPLTFWYWPAIAPVTVTLKVQLPLAASDPPVNAIVLVAAVVVRLLAPPH
jgi:hypothetical protein